MKLLLVEDNEQLNKALSAVLKRNSYIVDSVFDGEDALAYIKDYQYDIIILDIMLPKINGLEVLSRVRKEGNKTPILMLTAKSTVEDKITGLDLGADDYLAKPFEVEELLARLRALSRRNKTLENINIIEYGDLKLDVENLTLYCESNQAVLMNKELQLLMLLMKNGDKIVSQETIINNVWNSEEFPISDNVWVFISYLRKKLDSIHSKVKIKSIRYQGYYLEFKKD